MSSSIVMESSSNSIDISMVNEEQLRLVVLPEDIVFEILSCLPVVSLVRFKSVCKSWCSLIQTSRFISQHKHKDTRRHNLLLMLPHAREVGGIFKVLSCNNNKFQTYENLDLPKYFKINDIHELIRHANIVICDGIICLYHYLFGRDVLSLWNPATKQFRILPRSQHDHFPHNRLFGFGFDVETNDYKVVRVALSREYPNITSANTYNHIEVYSLTNNSWKSLEDFVLPIDSVISDPKMPLPYSNGGIYCWMGTYFVDRIDQRTSVSRIDFADRIDRRTSVSRIVSFDFSKEIFGTISLPNDPIFLSPCFLKLAILREKLAVINKDIRSYDYQIWVMNEFGVKESWTKLYTVGPFSFSLAIGFPKNEDLFLFEKDQHQISLCNLVTGQIDNLPALENSFIVQAAVYKESLLPIRSGVIK